MACRVSARGREPETRPGPAVANRAPVHIGPWLRMSERSLGQKHTPGTTALKGSALQGAGGLRRAGPRSKERREAFPSQEQPRGWKAKNGKQKAHRPQGSKLLLVVWHHLSVHLSLGRCRKTTTWKKPYRSLIRKSNHRLFLPVELGNDGGRQTHL